MFTRISSDELNSFFHSEWINNQIFKDLMTHSRGTYWLEINPLLLITLGILLLLVFLSLWFDETETWAAGELQQELHFFHDLLLLWPHWRIWFIYRAMASMTIMSCNNYFYSHIFDANLLCPAHKEMPNVFLFSFPCALDALFSLQVFLLNKIKIGAAFRCFSACRKIVFNVHWDGSKGMFANLIGWWLNMKL